VSKALGLAVGIGGLLFLPKLLIVLDAALRGRTRAFGGWLRALQSLCQRCLLCPRLVSCAGGPEGALP
jgi:membrane glycosyltransferase